jgi:hypothetical protein
MQAVKENSPTEEIVKEIKPGDEIGLVTKSGDRRNVTVSSISEGYIFSDEESYKLEDIKIIEVRRLDAGQTAVQSAAVVGGIGLGVLINVIINAILFTIITGLI